MAFKCPTCGADIPLRHVGVALYVCPFCRCTCALAEGGLAPGEVRAALLEPEGPFEVGKTGRLPAQRGGAAFQVTGQARYDTDGGGWDEWLLALDGGGFAVVEREEGGLVLFDERRLVRPIDLAARQLGDAVTVGARSIVVAELGTARLSAGRGALSMPFPAGEPFRFVAGGAQLRTGKVAGDGARAVVSFGRTADLDDFEIDG